MSIFSARAAEQLPAKQAVAAAWGRLFGQDCTLCGSGTRGELLCAACEQGLPRVASACVRCALPLRGAPACGSCLRHPPRFDAAVAAFDYRFPVDRMVQRFKQAGDLAVGAWLARALARRCAQRQRPDVLVVPPLTARRLRERGFNQAAELARTVGHELGIARDVRALRRLRDAAPQKALGARERRANLRGAFHCGARFDGMRVALVDDVLTTGATGEAITHLLKAAGAIHVEVWAVARTPAPGQ